MKLNDWIVANINNPNFTSSDFKNIGGLSLENTLLLPFEDYISKEKITTNPMFLNDSGSFDKDKFKNFYDILALKFQNFQQDSMLDNYEYGFWDVFKTPKSRIKNPEFSIDKISNPTHQSTGVIGINLLGDKTKSDFELAEKQKIFDWKKGKFTEETPEDSTLLSNPFKFIERMFSEPLVLAKYEENGEHKDPFTGQMVLHKAGENKLNDNGEYYFETLGGRSILGKNVLSLGDILTKEDSAVNKYDFFDSDDMEKSPEGVIAKNLTAVAPMLFLGPWYSGFYVGREILKSLPMLYNIGTALSDSEVPESINTLAGWAQSLTAGSTEESKSNTFSFENFGNLVSDVALQWGQQKLIANTIQKIKSSNKAMLDVAKAKAIGEYERQSANILSRAGSNGMSLKQALDLVGAKNLNEIKDLVSNDLWSSTIVGQKAIEKYYPEIEKAFAKRTRLGQDLSLMYMALISNTDVYDSMIEHGATKQEAATIALGSMAGMFAVDKYLGLGEMFFDDEEAAARRMYRKSLTESLEKDIAPSIGRLGTAPEVERESKNTLLNLFNKGKESASKFIKDYRYEVKDRSLGIVGKSVGEGLEEVSEELVTDIMKSLYQIAGQFGLVSLTNVGAWDNAMDRYLMSFFGGTIGGAMFGAVDAIKNPQSAADKNSLKELLHLVKEGRTLDILKELAVMRDRGLLGNKELSINTQKDTNTYITADENNISQNDFIYNLMKNAIQQMDKIINGNQLNLNEDLLFERMILSDIKLAHLKEFLLNGTYMSGYFKEYEDLVSDIYNNEVQIQQLQELSDPTKRTESYKEDLQKLIEKRDKLNERKEDFFKNRTLRYLRKTLFGTNADISGALLPMTYKQYVQLKYGKSEEYLTEALKAESKLLYDKYVKNRKLKDFDEAFEAWEEMTEKINPTLQDLDLGEIDIWNQTKKQLNLLMPEFGKLSYDTRVKPLDINVERELELLHVVRTSEYDKPWRSDSTKSNKTFDLLLLENPDMFFQIVKDNESNYWSIHFKTDNPNRTDKNPSYSGLTENQKKRLFKAAALVIPEGDFLSTHGELTPGGISGLNRFALSDFTGEIRFIKSGERKVKTKQVNHFDQIVKGTAEDGSEGEGQYTGNRNSDGIWNIVHSGSSVSARKMNRDEMSTFGVTPEEIIGSKDSWTDENAWNEALTNLKSFRVDKVLINPDDTKSVQVITDDGNSYTIKGESADKIFGILFATFNIQLYDSKDIKIPIWQKNTGETEEEYNDRNTKLDSETQEQFENRKKTRTARLLLLYEKEQYELLKKLVDSDASIDTNTYRQLIITLGRRAKDIKKNYLINLFKESQNYPRILEILEKLDENFDNQEEIWNLIVEVLREEHSLKFEEELSGAIEYNNLPKPLKDKGAVGLKEIVEYLEEQTKDYAKYVEKEVEREDGTKELVKIPYYYLWSNDEEFKEDYFDLATFINDSKLDENIKNDIKDLFNIRRFLNGSAEDGVTLFGNYVLEDGTKITGPINNIEFLREIQDKIIRNYLDDEGYSIPLLYDKEFKNKDFEKKVLQYAKSNYDNIIKTIKENVIYDTLVKLPKKIDSVNRPTLKLLKSIADKIGVNFTDIETTLQDILQYYNGLPEASDFRLSDPQIAALENAFNLIELAKAAITAASGKDSYFTPWNYNKTINEWNNVHKSEIDGDIKELPELDEDTANVLLQDLYQYLKEINGWIKVSKRNGINKVKMFEQFDTNFESVKLKFVMDNRDKMKLEDGTDLLEGFDPTENPKESVLLFERVFYANAQKAIAEGKTESDFFKMYSKFIDFDEAIKLKTSKLDLNLKELTEYDKFVYITSSIIYNPDNFYSDYKEFIKQNENIAPLSFLKHAIRIIKSLENNSDFVNKMLDLFKEKTNFKGVVLYNTSITTGIGGSGKTSVVAKGVISDNVSLSGPTDDLVVNLKSSLGDFESYNKAELLKFILESLYDKFNTEQTAVKDLSLLKFVENSSGDFYDISKVNVKKMDKPYKQLVIDEATLFSNAELLVISKFCKENEILLILVGDENLNGHTGTGWNMSRENTLSIRVPKMGLSLRETNLWKYLNLDTLQNLEDSLRETDKLSETEAVAERLNNTDLKKFKLKYYLKDGEFFGDMISSGTLSEEQLNALKKQDGKICFVGSTSSDVYQQLHSLGKPIEVKTIEEVQGHEYSYVVVDYNWKNLEKDITNPIKLLNFMLILYTAITRSENGTILIDNGLSDIIGGSQSQNYNSPTVNLDTESINRFIKRELEWIDSHTWNPSNEKITITPKKVDPKVEIPAEPEDDSPIVKPVNDDNIRNGEVDFEPEVSYHQFLQLHVYTNFNYLGTKRRVVNGKGVWYNDDDSHRDIGIFLRKGTELVSDEDKQLYTDKLLDLKSAILFGKTEASYMSNPFSDIPRDNVKNAKYFVVKEAFDPEIHHHVTLEDNLKDLAPGTTFYTVQARFKDSKGNDCIVTLANLPDFGNTDKKIYKDSLSKELAKVPDTKENLELREWYKKLINNSSFFDKQFKELQDTVNGITNEREINKPNFIGMTGLRYLKNGDKKYHLRLEEVNSFNSGYNVRTSSYIISPIYSAVDSSLNDPNNPILNKELGKPFILVSADRSLSPSDLINVYEEQIDNPSLPITVRRIMLDSMGISFESLFDERYRELFTTVGSGDKTFTFPFDLLPMGIRMYTALHNFRARLLKLDEKIKKVYPDKNKLIAVAKEESRLFLLHKADGNPNLTNTQFKNWLTSNSSLIKNGITLDDIKNLWKFNEVDLKDVKLFRIGYSEDSGVYIRNITKDYNGNYINPEIAGLWLHTINKIFEIVLDKIIPPESLTGINTLSDITDYKKLGEFEENWVKNAEKDKFIRLTLSEDEDSEKDVSISIPGEKGLRAIPIILSLIVKNLQARLRMSDYLLSDKFSKYDSDDENHYAVKLKTEEGELFIKYLDILEGGLEEIGHKSDKEPGIYGDRLYDNRLVNMFNTLFHGAISLWENKNNRNDFLKDRKAHAKDVLFPYGFFVDPILGGTVDDTARHRIVATAIKFYATNMIPSGVKAFIDFSPVVTASEEINEEEGNNEEINFEFLTLLGNLNMLFTENPEDSSWITDEIKTSEDLIKNARKKIQKDLDKNFGTSSPLTFKSLLNCPISIDDEGKITRVIDKFNEKRYKLPSESATIHQNGESFEITDSDNIYTVTKDGNVTMNSILERAGNLEVSIQSFIKYWKEFYDSDDNNEDGSPLIMSYPPDGYETLTGYDEIVIISDDNMKEEFKRKVKNALEEINNNDSWTMDDLDTLLNNYLMCK